MKPHIQLSRSASRVAALPCAAALALACGAAVGQDAGVLLRRQPRELLPGVNTTGTSFDVTTQVYNTIVEFERGGTKVVPGLAESWDISPDGTEYTFTCARA